MTDASAVPPRISDHARLRYLERVHGIDMGAIDREMMTDALKDAIERGASGVLICGVDYKIDAVARVVTTVYRRKRQAGRCPRVREDERGW